VLNSAITPKNTYNYKQNSHFVGNQIILHWKQLNYLETNKEYYQKPLKISI